MLDDNNLDEEFQRLKLAVHIENSKDELDLRYLVTQVSPAKLWISIGKHQAKWFPRKPFVSLLAKWHRVRIPLQVSKPMSDRKHVVYAVTHKGTGKIKVGFTSIDIRERFSKIVTLRGKGRGQTDVDNVFDLSIVRTVEVVNVEA